MGRPRVRAVVLNYNGGEHVLRCLEALEATRWPVEALEIVVVDNDSSDGSDRAIEATYPTVTLLRTGSNLGFPGNNVALRDLDAVDYVALVNNDAFVEPDWLESLVGVLDADPGLGAACPKIVFAPGFVEVEITSPTFEPSSSDGRTLGVRVSGVRVDGQDSWRGSQFVDGFWGVEQGLGAEPTFAWTDGKARIRVPVDPGQPASGTVAVRLAGPSGARAEVRCGPDETEVEVGEDPVWAEVRLEGDPFDVINNAGSVIVEGGYGADRGFLEQDRGQYDEPAEVFNWCGAGVVFPVRYLREVGLFDERFFMYYEDTDLSWRGRAQGWRYLYVPTSCVRHLHAATSVEGSALFQHFVERNRLLMLVKNAPLTLALGASFRYLLTTGSYARRDVVRPVLGGHRPDPRFVARRARSYLGFLRLLPAMLAERRRLRHRQIVRDEELVGWMVPQP